MIKGDGFSSLHHQRQDEAYDLFRVEQLIDFSLETRKDGGEGGRFHAYCSKLCKVSKVDDFLFMPWIFALLSQARLSMVGLFSLFISILTYKVKFQTQVGFNFKWSRSKLSFHIYITYTYGQVLLDHESSDIWIMPRGKIEAVHIIPSILCLIFQ